MFDIAPVANFLNSMVGVGPNILIPWSWEGELTAHLVQYWRSWGVGETQLPEKWGGGVDGHYPTLPPQSDLLPVYRFMNRNCWTQLTSPITLTSHPDPATGPPTRCLCNLLTTTASQPQPNHRREDLHHPRPLHFVPQHLLHRGSTPGLPQFASALRCSAKLTIVEPPSTWRASHASLSRSSPRPCGYSKRWGRWRGRSWWFRTTATSVVGGQNDDVGRWQRVM